MYWVSCIIYICSLVPNFSLCFRAKLSAQCEKQYYICPTMISNIWNLICRITIMLSACNGRRLSDVFIVCSYMIMKREIYIPLSGKWKQVSYFTTSLCGNMSKLKANFLCASCACNLWLLTYQWPIVAHGMFWECLRSLFYVWEWEGKTI